MSVRAKSASKRQLPRTVADPNLRENLEFLLRAQGNTEDALSVGVIGAPYFQYLKQSAGGAAATTDLFLRVVVPAEANGNDRKGTLSAWVARGGYTDADPDAAPDGTIRVIGTTLLSPSDTWNLTGGGTAALLNDLKVHSGKGKRIYFELVLDDGVTTGKRDFRLGPTTSPIGDTGGLNPGTVGTTQLVDTAVIASKLAAAAVEREKILDGAVNDLKLAAAAVTSAKLALLAVNTQHIVDSAVSGVKIATSAITNTKIADDAISTPKLQALSITSAKLAAGAVVAGKISAGAIDATNLIANGIITGSLVATGTITGTNIAGTTITGSHLVGLTITGDKISANAITASKILAGEIQTLHLAAGAVTANKLSALQLVAGQYIRSSNYVAGSTGWNIDAGGAAEFSNVTVRGTIAAGSTVAAANFTAPIANFFQIHADSISFPGTGDQWRIVRDAGNTLQFVNLFGGVQINMLDNGDLSFDGPHGPYLGTKWRIVCDTTAVERGLFFTSTAGVQRFHFEDDPSGTKNGYALSGNWVSSSDRRLKTDLAPRSGSLARVRSIQPVRFQRSATGIPEIGFAAQDVKALIPEAVFDMGTVDDVPDTLGLSALPLVAELWQAVRELADRVDTLTPSAA